MLFRWITGVLFFAIAALPYAAMLRAGRQGRPPPAKPERVLAITSPHRREVRLEYSRGFAEWSQRRTGKPIGIRWLDVGGAGKILKDIESRYAASPGNPGLDLLFGGGVAPYLTGIEQNWLAPVALPKEALDDIPARCAGAPVYDAQGRWYGVALSGFGILYNAPLVRRLRLPAPAGWEDLGRPEYFTWVGSGDPRSSGSVHMCYEIMLQAFGYTNGWHLITRICANVRRFGEGGGTVPREVAAGDVAAGMVIDQYAQTVIDAVGGNLMRFVLPARATVIGPDAIALFRNAPSPEAARLFVEYALSAEGQRLLCQPAGNNGQQYALHRLPVRASLYEGAGAPAANPYLYAGGFAYDESRGNRRRKVVDDLIGVCLIDGHASLVAAWEAVLRAGSPPDLVAALCAPVAAEDEVNRLCGAWGDPRRRLDAMKAWAQTADSRCRAVLRAARGAGAANRAAGEELP